MESTRKVRLETPYPEPTINLALDTIKKRKQALVFVNTKRGAEKCAEDISKKIKTKDPKLEELSLKLLHSLSRPTKQCQRLAMVAKKGIVFHHSGLTHEQRTLIEENFRKGVVKIICATPTLALGVDLPAFRAIIRDLRRYGFRGYNWIPVLEYLQQSGRAGRPSFDKYGESIAVASTKPEKKTIFKRYVLGEPEDIYSKLAVEPVLRTYVLSLIVSRIVSTNSELIKFFEKTFWAYQFKDMAKLTAIINKMIGLLNNWGFVKVSEQDFKPADELGKQRDIRATALGKRVSELYIDPLTAYSFIKCLQRAKSQPINEFSFLHMASSTLEMRPLLKARVKEYDDMQEAIALNQEKLLQKEPSMYDPAYDQFIDSIKTALFFQAWINEKDEEFLLESFNIRPGEIRVKLDKADWLLYATQELCRILKLKKVLTMVTKTRIRIKYGVREELFPLLKLKNIGRVRARRMYNNNVKNIADVKKTDMATLTQILGPKIAINVKEQLGQKVEQAKPKKRKGQISLKDY
jgi:helicase